MIVSSANSQPAKVESTSVAAPEQTVSSFPGSQLSSCSVKSSLIRVAGSTSRAMKVAVSRGAAGEGDGGIGGGAGGAGRLGGAGRDGGGLGALLGWKGGNGGGLGGLGGLGGGSGGDDGGGGDG